MAYTDIDPADDQEKIHFCDVSYNRPSIAGVDCTSLDVYASTKIDTLSRIALHEMTHYSSVGPASGLAAQIGDSINADGYYAYDPDRTHGLIAQDKQPGLCEVNADSYAWMAADAYWSYACTTTPTDYAAFFQDPPPYEPESSSDDGDDNNEPASDSDNPDD